MQKSKVKSQNYNSKFKKKVYIVGNTLASEDSLPIKLLPRLKKLFPQHTFIEIDPNENFVPEECSIIIDNVHGIEEVKWFDTLDEFVITKSVSPHDYDLGFHLQMLKKLGKLKRFKILGIPIQANKVEIFQQIKVALKSL